MTANAHRVHYTFREYLAHEGASNVKHEYLDGQIYAMAGGTPSRAALASAVVGQLYAQLRTGPCRLYSSDLRVRVLATGLATYPDVTIVCGPRELDPEDENTVTNPTLVVEVLSPSTEEYDRGEKLEHYQRIPRAPAGGPRLPGRAAARRVDARRRRRVVPRRGARGGRRRAGVHRRSARRARALRSVGVT